MVYRLLPSLLQRLDHTDKKSLTADIMYHINVLAHYRVHIYIYIYIYHKGWQHGLSWLSLSLPLSLSLSLAICLYRPSIFLSRLDSIHCPHRADKCRLLLVGHLNVSYPFVFTLPTVSDMSCSSYLNSLRDRRWVVVQLLFFRVLLPGYVQNKCSS